MFAKSDTLLVRPDLAGKTHTLATRIQRDVTPADNATRVGSRFIGKEMDLVTARIPTISG